MDKGIAFLIVVVNYILQTTVFKELMIFGVSPNTALIIVVCFALIKDLKYTIGVAFFAGLLQDMFYSNVLGINIYAYILIGLVAHQLKHTLPFNKNVTAVIYVLLSTVAYHVIHYVILYFHGVMGVSLLRFIRETVVIEGLINVIFTYVIYNIIALLYKKAPLSFTSK